MADGGRVLGTPGTRHYAYVLRSGTGRWLVRCEARSCWWMEHVDTVADAEAAYVRHLAGVSR